MSHQISESVLPSFVDLTDGSDFMRALRPVVYDHEDERFVNNANESRRFALHIRCKDIEIEQMAVNDTFGVMVGRIPSAYVQLITQVEEKLVDIINATPHFSERDEDADFSVMTCKSFVRVHSNSRAYIRMEMDTDTESDTRSVFFERTNDEEPPEIAYKKLKKGMVLDTILQILVDVDEDRREAIFTAVIEEASVTIPEEPAVQPKKQKRKLILHGGSSSSRR
jgi:hypothetical protein